MKAAGLGGCPVGSPRPRWEPRLWATLERQVSSCSGGGRATGGSSRRGERGESPEAACTYLVWPSRQTDGSSRCGLPAGRAVLCVCPPRGGCSGCPLRAGPGPHTAELPCLPVAFSGQEDKEMINSHVFGPSPLSRTQRMDMNEASALSPQKR